MTAKIMTFFFMDGLYVRKCIFGFYGVMKYGFICYVSNYMIVFNQFVQIGDSQNGMYK